EDHRRPRLWVGDGMQLSEDEVVAPGPDLSARCRARMTNRPGPHGSEPAIRSAAQAETLDQRPVALDLGLPQVLEQATTLTDQEQQATTRVVVVLVLLEVFGEVLDALCEQGHLDLRGAGVALVRGVLGDDLLLDGGLEGQRFSFGDVVARSTGAGSPGHDASAADLTAAPGYHRHGTNRPGPVCDLGRGLTAARARAALSAGRHRGRRRHRARPGASAPPAGPRRRTGAWGAAAGRTPRPPPPRTGPGRYGRARAPPPDAPARRKSGWCRWRSRQASAPARPGRCGPASRRTPRPQGWCRTPWWRGSPSGSRASAPGPPRAPPGHASGADGRAPGWRRRSHRPRAAHAPRWRTTGGQRHHPRPQRSARRTPTA